MIYRLAADAVLLIHALFVAFVVGGLAAIIVGKFLRWAWVHNLRFRIAHLLAIGVVVAESWADVVCPLTSVESLLRAKAGEASYAGDFVAYWLETLLYFQAPPWVFTVCYTAFGILVVATWFWVKPRRKASPT